MLGSPEAYKMDTDINTNPGLNLNINKNANQNGTTKTANPTDRAEPRDDSNETSRPGLNQVFDSIIRHVANEIVLERKQAGMAKLEPGELALEVRQRLKEGILNTGRRGRRRRYEGLI